MSPQKKKLPKHINEALTLLGLENSEAISAIESIPERFDTSDDFVSYVKALEEKGIQPDWEVEAEIRLGVDSRTTMTLHFDVMMESLLSTYRDEQALSLLESYLTNPEYSDVKDIILSASKPHALGLLLKAKISRNGKTDYYYGDQAKGYIDVCLMGTYLHFDFLSTIAYLSQTDIFLENDSFASQVRVPLKVIRRADRYENSYMLLSGEISISIDLVLRKL